MYTCPRKLVDDAFYILGTHMCAGTTDFDAGIERGWYVWSLNTAHASNAPRQSISRCVEQRSYIKKIFTGWLQEDHCNKNCRHHAFVFKTAFLHRLLYCIWYCCCPEHHFLCIDWEMFWAIGTHCHKSLSRLSSPHPHLWFSDVTSEVSASDFTLNFIGLQWKKKRPTLIFLFHRHS